MPIYRPQWLLDMEEERGLMDFETRIARNRYMIKSACLAHAPLTTLRDLSELVGVPYHTIAGTFKNDHPMVTPELAIKIEKAVGKAVLPRKYLRPDLFE